MGSGGGKGSAKYPVVRYYLSMFWGICAAGNGIELLEIKFGDKLAWQGSLKENGEIEIDKGELFGGDKKEGGVRGIATWLNGNDNQMLTERLASKFRKPPSELPGYRGLASIFFTGVPVPPPVSAVDANGNPLPGAIPTNTVFNTTSRDTGRGFLVCANNPYLKTISVRVRRPSAGLNPSIAMIRLKDSSKGRPQYASNAAHIIFEAMTDTDFGMGESLSMFNIPSFEQCASVLYNEKLGLNILWNRQSKIEDFIKSVLDHIQGAVFVDPATGLHTMKLFRGDYQIGNLKTISPDNAKISNFKTKSWGEISNEVVVTWTNPESGKEETVTVQDAAGIAAQGAITSTARNYHGLGDGETAIRCGERDLAAVAYPLASCDADVTREFWDSVTNECVILNWPRHGINFAVFRIVDIKSTSARTVKLSLIEDVFSLDKSDYGVPADSEWQNPSVLPQPLINTIVTTAPAFFTVRALGLNDISELEYPEVIAGVMAAPDSYDDTGAELVGYTSTATGVEVRKTITQLNLAGIFYLPNEMDQAVSNVLEIDSGFIGNLPRVGDFLLFGSGNDRQTELVAVTGVNGSWYTLLRGMLDTVPKKWMAGTRIVVIPVDSITGDATRRSAFETVDYHFRTITTNGILPLHNTPKISTTLSERPHLPNRPANVTVGGVRFGTFNMGTASSVVVNWANRNRLTEATQTPRWTDPSASVELGQTTKVTVLRYSNRAILSETTNITGTTVTLPRSAFGASLDTIVRVTSVRDGFESLQGHEVRVTLA